MSGSPNPGKAVNIPSATLASITELEDGHTLVAFNVPTEDNAKAIQYLEDQEPDATFRLIINENVK